MKVLILERTNPLALTLDGLYLERRGHEVVTARSLDTIAEYLKSPDTYLNQFDRVICHPVFSDVPPLKKELERRKNFGVLIYKLEGPSEFNGRLRYKDWLYGDILQNFVENPL